MVEIIKGNKAAEVIIAASVAAGKALSASDQVTAAQAALKKQEANNVKPLAKAMADAKAEVDTEIENKKGASK